MSFKALFGLIEALRLHKVPIGTKPNKRSELLPFFRRLHRKGGSFLYREENRHLRYFSREFYETHGLRIFLRFFHKHGISKKKREDKKAQEALFLNNRKEAFIKKKLDEIHDREMKRLADLAKARNGPSENHSYGDVIKARNEFGIPALADFHDWGKRPKAGTPLNSGDVPLTDFGLETRHDPVSGNPLDTVIRLAEPIKPVKTRFPGWLEKDLSNASVPFGQHNSGPVGFSFLGLRSGGVAVAPSTGELPDRKIDDDLAALFAASRARRLAKQQEEKAKANQPSTSEKVGEGGTNVTPLEQSLYQQGSLFGGPIARVKVYCPSGHDTYVSNRCYPNKCGIHTERTDRPTD
jgi:hypothetical protein